MTNSAEASSVPVLPVPEEAEVAVEDEEEVPEHILNAAPKYTRFKGAPWFGQQTPVIIGGAGGIGSWLSMYLARIGCEIHIYDFDSVESHNTGGQLYGEKHVGQLKTDALKDVLKTLCSFENITTYSKYDENALVDNVMFSAFDNMSARKVMFERWAEHVADLKGTEPAIFIDGRLLAEQMQVFCVTPDRIKEYREHLFEDSEIAAEPCSYKQTSHCAAIIGGLMTGFYTNFLTNIKEGGANIPFHVEYFLPMNRFVKG